MSDDKEETQTVIVPANIAQVTVVVPSSAEAQLATVLRREAESQARHDAKVAALEAEIEGFRKGVIAEAINTPMGDDGLLLAVSAQLATCECCDGVQILLLDRDGNKFAMAILPARDALRMAVDMMAAAFAQLGRSRRPASRKH
jgi:hypothetical protein